MPVTAEEISSTLTEYLLTHSGKAGPLAPLTAELAKKGDDPDVGPQAAPRQGIANPETRRWRTPRCTSFQEETGIAADPSSRCRSSPADRHRCARDPGE